MTTVTTTPESAAPATVALGAKRVKRRLTSPWASLAAVIIAVLWTIPTFGLLVTSFRPQADVEENGWWNAFLHPSFTLDNYKEVFSTVQGGATFKTYFINSIVIVIPSVFIPISLACLAAYAFAWIDFKGRDFFFVLIFALQIVPIQVTLIPLLSLYVQAGPGGHVLDDLDIPLDLRLTPGHLPAAQLHEGRAQGADRGGSGRRCRPREDLLLGHAPAAQAGARRVRHLPVPVGLERPAGRADLRGWYPERRAA